MGFLASQRKRTKQNNKKIVYVHPVLPQPVLHGILSRHKHLSSILIQEAAEILVLLIFIEANSNPETYKGQTKIHKTRIQISNKMSVANGRSNINDNQELLSWNSRLIYFGIFTRVTNCLSLPCKLPNLWLMSLLSPISTNNTSWQDISAFPVKTASDRLREMPFSWKIS